MTSTPALNYENTSPADCPLPVIGRGVATTAEIRQRPSTRTVGVLHVINGEHYAGAERVQDLLALGLPELGFHVGFACVKPRQFAELRQSRDAPLYDVPMLGRLDLRAAWRIARIVRREGYELIHGHTVRTAMIGRLAAALAGVPMVYHAHSPTSRNTARPWLNRLGAIVERGSLAGVSRVIAVSESLGRHLRSQGVDPRKITVVRNGVPSVDNLPPRRPPKHRWTLGTIALFRPRKGIEVLLEALALLHQRQFPVRLRAVGSFEDPHYAVELALRTKQLALGELVQWAGFARDVTAELSQIDLLVLPSLFGEGLPMVVLEAMAAGVPVVATSVEGVPEAIRDGQDGVIVRPGDPHDLAAGIGKILSATLDWSALRRSALGRHAEQFSDRAMAAGVAAVYREVLAPGVTGGGKVSGM